ncbi:MAG: ATP-binding cassette domain-containing protein, partial [Gaiellaceae bacterium]
STPSPMSEVGALLDAKDVHGGRSARAHLLALAQSNGIASRRVDEVLDLVGLQSVAKKRIKGFSLGMSQRLGIAGTMLGDPRVLLFDEPVNGLDPEGILWIRNFMKALAAEGRTVFVSSHLMSEMALTADHLIVIGRGRLIADASVDEFLRRHSKKIVRVRSPQADALVALISGPDVTASSLEPSLIEIEGLTAEQIGEAAAANGLVLHELTPQQVTLEDAFIDITQGDVEFRAHTSLDALDEKEDVPA